MANSKRNKGRRGPKTPEGKAKAVANLIPAKPGEVRNPAGRPTAGASIREYVNVLVAAEVPEPELLKLAKDASAPPAKRAAAIRVLRMVETPDLADFAPLVKGDKTIDELRAAGVNTAIVKKIKPCEFGVEIELHDRSGEDFDRVIEQTDGRPTQRVDMKHDGSIRSNAEGEAAADQLLAELRKSLGNPNPST